MIGDPLDLPAHRRRAASTAGSAGCSSSRPPPSASRHGANDAQKTMGIIAGVLFAGGYIDDVLRFRSGSILRARRDRPRHAVRRLADHPHDGLEDHQAAAGRRLRRRDRRGAIALFTATHFGVPVSTTHTITGAIVGVGATRRLSAVRWGVAGRIVWAWVLTIPMRRDHRRADLLDLRLFGAR